MRLNRTIFSILFVGIAATAAAVFYINKHVAPPDESTEAKTTITQQPTVEQKSNNTTATDSSFTTLNSAFLRVPFTPQAPTGNWDQLHNEACEEASAIMTHEYFSGNTTPTLPSNLVEDELSQITTWEQDHFGYYLDINSGETGQLLQDYYGLNAKVVTNFTEDYIKTELSQNHAVLLPANGILLGNPNFRNPGPPYHMLVIKGYTETEFITNDPGTRKGLNYPYTFNTLYNANGDYDHTSHSVDTNKKNIIVVWK